jgi:hypothetical protein
VAADAAALRDHTFFVGGGGYAAGTAGTAGSWTEAGLIGLLVLIAGISLLQRPLPRRGVFDLLLGMPLGAACGGLYSPDDRRLPAITARYERL